MKKSLGIEDIAAPSHPPSKKPDEKTKREKLSWQIAEEKKLAILRRSGVRQDINERKRYAERIFKLVSFWLIGVFFILIASGWRNGIFLLSDKVLLGLLGGTTLSVIGLFTIVASYLFPKSHDR